MTVKCICGEEFSIVDLFNKHTQTCPKYLEAIRLTGSYKEIVKETITQLKDGLRSQLGKLEIDYKATKITLDQITKDIKVTSEDKVAIVQAVDPNIYENALEALMIGTMILKEFKKLYGIPPLEALTKLMDLGRITVKQFKKLTGTKGSILPSKETIKRHLERTTMLSIMTISTYFLVVMLYVAMMGQIPHPLYLGLGSTGLYFALRAWKPVRQLQNGKV